MWWRQLLSAILALFVVYVGLRVVYAVTIGSFWEHATLWVIPVMMVLALPIYVVVRKLMFPYSRVKRKK